MICTTTKHITMEGPLAPAAPAKDMAVGKYYAAARADTLSFWTHEGLVPR